MTEIHDQVSGVEAVIYFYLFLVNNTVGHLIVEIKGHPGKLIGLLYTCMTFVCCITSMLLSNLPGNIKPGPTMHQM